MALAAVVALVASRTLSWDTIERQTHWGVLLLFGGGLALSQVMQVSGASGFLATALVDTLQGASVFWLVGLPGALLAVAIAVSASCAFMLPVATPPNAIVYATDQVPQATMMRCGFVLNLACIGVITLAATVWLLP